MSELYMKYFVLKPRGGDIYAMASRAALCAYADMLEEHDPDLARGVTLWAQQEEIRAARNNCTN